MPKLRAAAAALILAACLAGLSARAAEPLERRIFQLHHDDFEHIQAMYDWAEALGMNEVQLSHGIISTMDRLNASPEAVARFRALAESARDRGLAVHVWAQELNTADKAFCPDPDSRAGARFWAGRRQAYREALTAVPEISGVALSFGSAPTEPWHLLCVGCIDYCNRIGHPGRVRLVVDQVRRVVVEELGRKLAVRTFIHSPAELEWVIQGLEGVPDITVMAKDVPQDWQPFYPPNPAFAALDPMPAIMELDLAGEYWGLGIIPFCQVAYIKRRLEHGLGYGLVGAVGRIERGSHFAYDTPNHVNVYAFARLLNDPDTSVDSIWSDWIEEFYGLAPGTEAAAALRTILESTFDMGRKMYYAKGFWSLNKGSTLPDQARRPALLAGRSTALYDPDYRDLEAELLDPSEQTLRDLAQEKHEARYLAERNLELIEAVGPALEPGHYQDLKARLRLQLYAVRAWEQVTLLTWRHMLWSGSGHDRDRGIIEWRIQALELLAAEIEAELGESVPLADPGRIRALAADMREAVGPPVEPVEPGFFFLSGIGAEPGPEPGEVTVRWRSEAPASARVEYGLKVPVYQWAVESQAAPGTERSVVLSGLESGRRYVFRVVSESGDLGRTVSGDFDFIAP